MEVVYPERVFDLSSGRSHRRLMSSINHSPSATDSTATSEDKSRIANGGSISVSFNSAAYRLPDTLDQLQTPVINRVTSEDSWPVFKPFESPRPLPLPGSMAAVTTQANIELLPTQLRRRKSARAINDSSSDEVISQFSQWDNYRNTSQQSRRNEQIASKPPIRRASVRRNDFTSKKEVQQSKESKKFLFHKGFFKKTKSQPVTRRFLRNRAGLNAVLNFIDLQSMSPSDVVSSDVATTYAPRKLLRRCPAIIESYKAPLREYVAAISRQGSVQRSSKSPLLAERPKTTKKRTALSRSHSTPSAIRHIRSSSYSPQSRIVHELWKEYLRLVIFQRIQLRLSLTNIDDSASVSSKASPELSPIAFSSYSPDKQNRKHKFYRVSSQESYYSSTPPITPSSNAVCAMRKAY
ncbi:hypothetical protein HG535_0D00650 [Zygotorulaspora mrakii]|uniref:Uncharacterized protein n=1 Tax=Zygotorulaspora mrakii TaxID=42260 RepID=A0A7H9B143_ZYGMR|nr:uncharacterized protein HG535_0D00650 [Zygotorulaspora mrakii]QLG72358.1 hypothetical protein HG535_0D00650 [Zygotorulaspora mrakii]